MGPLEAFALLIIAAAISSFVNSRFFRLPSTIGLMLAGLVASAAILLLNRFFPALSIPHEARQSIAGIDFSQFLLRGVLGFFLFGGALHVDVGDLKKEKVPILVLACLGVVLSTAIIGFASHGVFRLLGVDVPLSSCFVFGALISPTDPIAVLGILERLHAPKSLEVRIAGESLFNDGFAIVIFSVLVSVAGPRAVPEDGTLFSASALLFLREVVGGIALGLLLGQITYLAMKKIDDPNVEVLLSFGLVVAVTLVAEKTSTSGPLACVAAGLLIGNRGRRYAMQEATRSALDQVWSFVDSVLNAMLFLLLGLEALVLWPAVKGSFPLLLLVPVVIGARWLSVGAGIALLRGRYPFEKGSLRLLTWGGLRGGISVAMALSLAAIPGRDAILIATYGVVVFSVLVQGLTMMPLTRATLRQHRRP